MPIAQTDEALRLVERDEILHAVAETARADGDICFKPLWAVRIGPRAALRKRLRIIPVEQRDKRPDAVGEQRVNQAVVKRDALLVDRARRPAAECAARRGRSGSFLRQPRHELYVFFDAVIMIAGDIAGVTAVDFARPVGKRSPDGRPLAALKCRAFNLVGRGRPRPK